MRSPSGPKMNPAERPHHKSRRHRAEGGDEVARAGILSGIKLLREDGGDQTEEGEVVRLHEVADGCALDGSMSHVRISDPDFVARPRPALSFARLLIHQRGRIPQTPPAYAVDAANWPERMAKMPRPRFTSLLARAGGRLLRSRRLVRAPIWIYKARAGALFGSRILMLEHLGRKSGARRYAVLEVVDHAPDNYVVASGFGRKAQWFRNIQANRRVRVYAGSRRPAPATARVLDQTEADRARWPPTAAGTLGPRSNSSRPSRKHSARPSPTPTRRCRWSNCAWLSCDPGPSPSSPRTWPTTTRPGAY